MLDQIAEDLHEGSSPEMTQRVADYFMEKGLFDKAMEMLVRTKKMDEALKLCTLHSVPLTEELVEKISIPKTDNGSLIASLTPSSFSSLLPSLLPSFTLPPSLLPEREKERRRKRKWKEGR